MTSLTRQVATDLVQAEVHAGVCPDGATRTFDDCDGPCKQVGRDSVRRLANERLLLISDALPEPAAAPEIDVRDEVLAAIYDLVRERDIRTDPAELAAPPPAPLVLTLVRAALNRWPEDERQPSPHLGALWDTLAEIHEMVAPDAEKESNAKQIADGSLPPAVFRNVVRQFKERAGSAQERAESYARAELEEIGAEIAELWADTYRRSTGDHPVSMLVRETANRVRADARTLAEINRRLWGEEEPTRLDGPISASTVLAMTNRTMTKLETKLAEVMVGHDDRVKLLDDLGITAGPEGEWWARARVHVVSLREELRRVKVTVQETLDGQASLFDALMIDPAAGNAWRQVELRFDQLKSLHNRVVSCLEPVARASVRDGATLAGRSEALVMMAAERWDQLFGWLVAAFAACEDPDQRDGGARQMVLDNPASVHAFVLECLAERRALLRSDAARRQERVEPAAARPGPVDVDDLAVHLAPREYAQMAGGLALLMAAVESDPTGGGEHGPTDTDGDRWVAAVLATMWLVSRAGALVTDGV